MFIHNRISLLITTLLLVACGSGRGEEDAYDADPATWPEGVAVPACGDLPLDGAETCEPGSVAKALCLGEGMTGERSCNADGRGFGPTACETGEPIDSSATYLILTRKMFLNEVGGHVALWESRGERVQVIDAARAIRYAPGADVPEQIRNVLCEVKREARSAKPLLIVGAPRRDQSGEPVTELTEPWEIPLRYVRHPYETQRLMDELEGHPYPYIPTLQYYASLSADWPAEGDGWLDAFDFKAELYPVIFSVREKGKVHILTEKVKNWEPPQHPRHSLLDTWACQPGMSSQPYDKFKGALVRFSHQLKDHRCESGKAEQAVDVANAEQADFLTVTSHGTPYEAVVVKNGEGKKVGYRFNTGSKGFSKNPVCLVNACQTAGVDYPQDSLAESQLSRPDGCVAYVGSDRISWHYPSLWESVFIDGHARLGEAVYEAKRDAFLSRQLAPKEIAVFLMAMPHGDPAMEMFRPDVSLKAGPVSIDDGVMTAAVDYRVSLARPVGGRFVHAARESSSSGVVIGSGRGSLAFSVKAPAGGPLQPREALIGFDGCEPGKVSCTLARFTVQPEYPLTCGDLHFAADGETKEFTLWVGESIPGPVVLRVTGQDGRWYKDGCGDEPCLGKETLVEMSLSEGLEPGYLPLSFSRTFTDEDEPAGFSYVDGKRVPMGVDVTISPAGSPDEVLAKCSLLRSEFMTSENER
jgi:hypothetical protein